MQPSVPMPKLSLDHFRMLIDGQLVESEIGRWFDSINPATEAFIARLPLGSALDVERAVAAAQKAQPAWAGLPVAQRSAMLRKLAEAITARSDELLYLEVMDTGNVINKMTADVSMGVNSLLYYAGLGYEVKGSTIPSTPNNLHLTIREPYGVVGRIIPFNHPILFAISRLGAPLITGNTMVIKPPQQSPLSAALLAEICRPILPPGVVNIVTGSGREVGDAIVRHPKIKRLGLIGSTETGMAIQRQAAECAIKNITLELGGKNPLIVFPDADLPRAVRAAVDGMNFAWEGQSCGSTSRLLLHESVYDEVLDGVVKTIAGLRLGDPLDWQSDAGPINNRHQYEKTARYAELGQEEGARLMIGGKRPAGKDVQHGFWFEPTVFGAVTPEMRIAREEIFGPIISVLKWKDPEEVYQLANSLEVGLTASIFTRDLNTAVTAAKRIQAGYIWINQTAAHYPATPFGGYKNSGIGREGISFTLEEMSQLKTIVLRRAFEGA